MRRPPAARIRLAAVVSAAGATVAAVLFAVAGRAGPFGGGPIGVAAGVSTFVTVGGGAIAVLLVLRPLLSLAATRRAAWTAGTAILVGASAMVLSDPDVSGEAGAAAVLAVIGGLGAVAASVVLALAARPRHRSADVAVLVAAGVSVAGGGVSRLVGSSNGGTAVMVAAHLLYVVGIAGAIVADRDRTLGTAVSGTHVATAVPLVWALAPVAAALLLAAAGLADLGPGWTRSLFAATVALVAFGSYRLRAGSAMSFGVDGWVLRASASLPGALVAGRLVGDWRPVTSTADGRAVGGLMSLRWDDGRYDRLDDDELDVVATASGLGVPLDLRRVGLAIAGRPERGRGFVCCSRASLETAGFADRVLEELAAGGTAGDALAISFRAPLVGRTLPVVRHNVELLRAAGIMTILQVRGTASLRVLHEVGVDAVSVVADPSVDIGPDSLHPIAQVLRPARGSGTEILLVVEAGGDDSAVVEAYGATYLAVPADTGPPAAAGV